MLYSVMLYVRKCIENCWVDLENTKRDTYVIKDGYINLPFLREGQYFIIDGSYFNDGVYRYDYDLMLDDEESEFLVVSIKPPKAFIELVHEIEDWQFKHGNNASKPFSSESFDGYSYTRATGKDGSFVTWKDVFEKRLNPWRML